MDELYNKHNKLNLPTEDELLALLMRLLQDFGQTYVIIDALDECGNDYDQLFDKVIKVIHGWQLVHFHLLVSSRREEGIIINMEEMAPTQICLTADLVGNDITSYIDSAVVNAPRFKKWGSAVQQDIRNALIGGANGMCVYSFVIRKELLKRL
jgi:hypothetical protein